MGDSKNLMNILDSLIPSDSREKPAISKIITRIEKQNEAHEKSFKKVEKDIENASKRPARKKLTL